MESVPADRRSFPPEVAIHLVKIACERPDKVGRSLSHWDCAELSRQLKADGVVDSISPQTVQRILADHKLKPWRKHLWLSPKAPRDADFCRRVKNICTLYSRKLAPHEQVLCVDEIAWARGRTYLRLVYDIGGATKRLLAVAEERTEASERSCRDGLGKPVCLGVKIVCSDVWRPYLNVIAEKLGQAVHVLDRFHGMQQFGKALDEVRAKEAKQLVRDGYELVLKKSCWCLLRRPENLTDKQTVKLSELLNYNVRTVRAYLLRKEFPRLWEYKSAWRVGEFLDV